MHFEAVRRSGELILSLLFLYGLCFSKYFVMKMTCKFLFYIYAGFNKTAGYITLINTLFGRNKTIRKKQNPSLCVFYSNVHAVHEAWLVC